MRGTSTFVAIALSLVVGTAGARAQTPASPSHQHDATAPAPTRPAPAVHDHGAAPVDLTALLAKMDASKGEAKIAVMSDIIKQLVADGAGRATRPEAAAAPAPGRPPMASMMESMMSEGQCPHCASMMKGDMKDMNMDMPMKMDHK